MNNDLQHEKYMTIALELAKKAQDLGEVPVGAVIIDENGEIVSGGFNNPIMAHDPTAHAEIMAIRMAAQKFENYRLAPQLTMYVTLEPCTMCASAISNARIKTLIYGATDAKGGAIQSGVKFYDSPNCHHKPQIISGILEQDCVNILKNFFKNKRQK